MHHMCINLVSRSWPFPYLDKCPLCDKPRMISSNFNRLMENRSPSSKVSYHPYWPILQALYREWEHYCSHYLRTKDRDTSAIDSKEDGCCYAIGKNIICLASVVSNNLASLVEITFKLALLSLAYANNQALIIFHYLR